MQKVQDFVVGLFKKIPVQYRFISMVVLAFVAAISFCLISSHFADSNGLNWLFLVLGVVLAFVVLTVVKEGLEENN